MKKGTAYLRDNPKLMAEWNYEKNGDLNPLELTAFSSKKVWWKCENGHEWMACVGDRSGGSRCPYCAGSLPIIGQTDLATVHPHLAKEWHPTKNGELKPSDFLPNSNKKVWWKCEMGHEWEAKIQSRSNGSNCPYCAGKKVLIGYNDLATTHPHLAKEWHPTKNGELTPFDITAGSDKKVWWMCDMGHEWQTQIKLRSRGTGCPICNSGSKTSFPEQAIYFYLSQVDSSARNRELINGEVEVDIYLPSFGVGIEYDGEYFHAGTESKEMKKNEYLKEQGIRLIRVKETKRNLDGVYVEGDVIIFPIKRNYIYLNEAIHHLISLIDSNAEINVDTSRDNIAILELYKLNFHEASLEALYPNLVKEWHPTKNGKLLPSMFTPKSMKKIWWICEKGHEWQTHISSRTAGGQCPICSSRKVLKGYNDLETLNPEIAKEWHPTKNGELQPSDFTYKSKKKIWWLCKNGHEWKATILSRSYGTGCPYCSNKAVIEGFNDLATLNPELAKEWHPTKNGELKPSDVTSGSGKKVWWSCSKGHEWQATIGSRNAGHSCPYCSNKLAWRGYNDLATLNPELAREWHITKNGGLLPSDVTAGSSKKVWWKCSVCGYEWQAVVGSRNSRCSCPACSGRVAVSGFNDLATTHPHLVKEWHPTKNGELTPSDVTKGSEKKIWWICEKGHEWQAMIYSRAKGGGCPFCSGRRVLSGFNDLATLRPEIAKEWHPTKNEGLKPSDVTVGFGKKVWWICEKGHEWQDVIEHRTYGSICPECAKEIRKKRVSQKDTEHTN